METKREFVGFVELIDEDGNTHSLEESLVLTLHNTKDGRSRWIESRFVVWLEGVEYSRAINKDVFAPTLPPRRGKALRPR